MKLSIQSDIEKARSIKKIVQERKDFIINFKRKVSTTIICENYYEIIKELATALFLCKGFKFVGDYAHKELIYEIVNLLNLEESYLVFLDDFRTRRNGSLYYGERFEKSYLDNNGDKMDILISKIEIGLNRLLDKKNEK
ncbi:MAG: hypothetical protein AABW83_03700 [Nanoarchaeota archaeon]